LDYYIDMIRESLRSRGFLESEPRGIHPRLKFAAMPPDPVPPQITWGVRIFTLHLNYVAGYTDPVLFLFKRTYNYYVDNQRLVCVPLSGWVQNSFSLIGEGPE